MKDLNYKERVEYYKRTNPDLSIEQIIEYTLNCIIEDIKHKNELLSESIEYYESNINKATGRYNYRYEKLIEKYKNDIEKLEKDMNNIIEKRKKEFIFVKSYDIEKGLPFYKVSKIFKRNYRSGRSISNSVADYSIRSNSRPTPITFTPRTYREANHASEEARRARLNAARKRKNEIGDMHKYDNWWLGGDNKPTKSKPKSKSKTTKPKSKSKSKK